MEWLCVIETKREQLIQQLTEEIQTGRFRTATKLPPERVLMEEMGVTRTLLREALMTMEGMGCLSIEGRSGITIIRNGEEKVAQNISGMVQWPSILNGEILEVRLILEIPAAKIAARVRNDVDLEQMDRCLSALSNVDYCDEKNYARGDEWDFLLHQAIIRTTGNGLLLRVYEGVASLMRDFTRRYRGMLFNHVDGWAQNAFREHKMIVEAIRAQNSEEAGEAMRVHLCRISKGYQFFGISQHKTTCDVFCQENS